ncbi:MAG: glycoside hydrolase family 57 protein [Muribaculaceae bacterium]|nr:glycoside hydrolase family 57 protein [Muribaculaceae bacterium]
MKAVCFNFEIHQPFRLKRYRFFDIGNDHYYYDDFLNDDIAERIVHQSYIPAAETLLRMIEDSKGAFRCSLAISGEAIEQFEHYAPEFNDLLRKLADTGKVEFLATPYAHSLSSLFDPEEFRSQVEVQCHKVKETYGATPKVLRNTELIYSDELAPQILAMGFKGVITEGAKHILGWKSPDYVYTAASAPQLKVLMRNAKLSDDIAVRFSDTSWGEYPLTADKYIDWIAATPADEQIINIGLSLDTFGGLHPLGSGILQFLEALPRFAAEKGIEFWTPSEAVKKLKPVGVISITHPISSAQESCDTSTWMGNALQNEALNKLYQAGERVRLCEDRRLKQDWWYLQDADHFYYMSTKDGGAAFSPYETPYQAFINYMNVLSDFLVRVDEQYPESIDNEELNSLLTTIRNQEREIATLTREKDLMSKNLAQYNIEHQNRKEAEEPAAKEPAKKKKAAPKAKAKTKA